MALVLGKNTKIYYAATTPTLDGTEFDLAPANTAEWTLVANHTGFTVDRQPVEADVTVAGSEYELTAMILKKAEVKTKVLYDLDDGFCDFIDGNAESLSAVPMLFVFSGVGVWDAGAKVRGIAGYYAISLSNAGEVKGIVQMDVTLKPTYNTTVLPYRLNIDNA